MVSRLTPGMDGPHPLRVAWSILRTRMRVRSPHPRGEGTVGHQALRPVLGAVQRGGTPALGGAQEALGGYVAALAEVDPDRLSRPHALAYWINLYNAGALQLAARATVEGANSVLRVPGGFESPFVAVAGERLSLDAIEHGKVRRFRDPRIHGALVCGSVSCPTLRAAPYGGEGLSEQLDDQMRRFLATGGALPDRERSKLLLSRVFRWYGGDFTRPHRMPTWLPAKNGSLLRALARWLPEEVAVWVASTTPRVEFRPYDWGLRCAVG